ncbi:hypothetical protein LBMAG42_31010 [Deltaproteobacteria bacterium]|nr:hypothetical protein LBMAG42_31010 [Deltaproteobacteria bacterium]
MEEQARSSHAVPTPTLDSGMVDGAPPVQPVPADLRALLSALGAVTDSVELFDREGRYTHVNSAWSRLTGFCGEESIGKMAPALVQGPHHDASLVAHIDAAITKGEAWEGELEGLNVEGGTYLCRARVLPVFDDVGQVNRVLVVRTDLSEQRAAERRIVESDARFQRAVFGAHDGLWEIDLARKQLHLSPRCRELASLPEGEIDLETARAAIHPDDLELLQAEFQRHLEGDTEHLVCEIRLGAGGDRWTWALVRAKLSMGADGRPERLAGGISDIQARKEAESRLMDAASRDPLTNLPNRRYFVDEVRHAVELAKTSSSRKFAVLFIDLRRFKQVNDQHGHSVGDELLRSVGVQLLAAVRPADTVARLGGDEFGVLLEPINGEAQMRAAARRIERTLSVPLEIDGRVVQVSGTVGAVMGDGSSRVDELIRDADVAMYTAREDGRTGFLIADPEMRNRISRRSRLSVDLPAAIRHKQLRVAFQPIVDLDEGRVIGAEALARWRHPDLGEVSPVDFVGIAEELGLGTDLGVCVLEESVAWLMEALREGVVSEDFGLHVNASARQLHDPRFVEMLKAAAAIPGMRRHSLIIEITETVLVERPDEITRIMDRLVAAGVDFALDDFGTGWSSLSHLRRFPVRCLKIDRSFTRAVTTEPSTAEIVRGLVSIAKALGMSTVAEGVETDEEAAAVRQLGCTRAQGFRFARPQLAREALLTLRMLQQGLA